MSILKRFGVALDDVLLKRFDHHIKRKKYSNRSEAIRDLIRAEFVREDWAGSRKEVVGAVIIVYNHHKRELVNKLLSIQHDCQAHILCSQHVHLSHTDCLEVIIAKGKPKELDGLLSQMKSERGVKFADLSFATTGEGLS